GRLLGPRIPEIRPGSSVADVRAAVSSWMRRALAANVADPWNFTSDEAADDIDDVRAALGYDSIDLYGGSYGATLALYYLRRHPEHTRAVVLDGGTLLHVPIFELIAGRSQEALDLVLERCAAEPSCRGSFPDLADRFGDVMRRLTRHPVATSARDPWSEEDVVVSADAFGELIHSLLVTSRAGDVPRTIRLAVDGEMDAVGQMIATVPTDPDDLRLLMSPTRGTLLSPTVSARGGAHARDRMREHPGDGRPRRGRRSGALRGPGPVAERDGRPTGPPEQRRRRPGAAAQQPRDRGEWIRTHGRAVRMPS
ncbi:MAG: alpha/beta hydrolase, partial [Actinomycetia bacterium]|nr:alpha/beta hydrolase [Actinomycetes bacterium]